MPKLNFYDTDAVKAFLLNTLIENKEAREDADFERRQTQTWFGQYQEQKARAEAAEANIKAAIAKLAPLQWSAPGRRRNRLEGR